MTYLTVGLIGGGPRGLATLEQCALRAHELDVPCRFVCMDDHRPGAGRVWHPHQSPELLMNTMAGQFTLFSGPATAGPARPGHGPSLYEWMRTQLGYGDATPNTYAPRRVAGRYMQFVLQAIQSAFPRPHVLHTVRGCIRDVRSCGDRFRLVFDGGRRDLLVDVLVLATGHATARLTGVQQQWTAFAKSSRRCRFLRGDSAADMPLDRIRPNEAVAVVGLGLGFHDVVALLTVGRGGRFQSAGRKLVYLPSGEEPRILAGSRSGLPIPARGVNQKPLDWRYRPRFFCRGALEAIRRRRRDSREDQGLSGLSFSRDVYPLIRTEAEHIYFGTWVRWLHGRQAAEAFWQDHAAARDPYSATPTSLLRRHGLLEVPLLDLDALARPFAGKRFRSPREFDAALLSYLERDLQEAALGNLSSPIKAACDMLRDVRDVLRSVVEFDGLDADSYDVEFKQDFAPVYSLLTAGPPASRVQQLLALHAAGIVEFVGPRMNVECDTGADCFRVSSAVVDGSQRAVTALIDSRVPFPSLAATENGVLPNMLRRGLVRPYRRGRVSDRPDSGGVEILPQTGQVVARDGIPHRNLFAIGLPTESPRWFTQVGGGMPGKPSRFTLDATVVADGCITALREIARRTSPHSEAA